MMHHEPSSFTATYCVSVTMRSGSWVVLYTFSKRPPKYSSRKSGEPRHWDAVETYSASNSGNYGKGRRDGLVLPCVIPCIGQRLDYSLDGKTSSFEN